MPNTSLIEGKERCIFLIVIPSSGKTIEIRASDAIIEKINTTILCALIYFTILRY